MNHKLKNLICILLYTVKAPKALHADKAEVSFKGVSHKRLFGKEQNSEQEVQLPRLGFAVICK